jgi:putative membrane protein
MSVIASAQFVEGVEVDGITAAAVAGLALVIMYKVIKPILKILTLPLNIITLGLFSVILNGLMFWFVGEVITGFTVAGLLPALFGSIFVSVLNWIADRAAKNDD